MCKLGQFIGVFVTIFVVFTLTTPLYAGLDDKSLVLYLSFDEGKGGAAADSSVHGHDGELIKGPYMGRWAVRQGLGVRWNKATACDGAYQ